MQSEATLVVFGAPYALRVQTATISSNKLFLRSEKEAMLDLVSCNITSRRPHTKNYWKPKFFWLVSYSRFVGKIAVFKIQKHYEKSQGSFF